jgi:hypothetical protein
MTLAGPSRICHRSRKAASTVWSWTRHKYYSIFTVRAHDRLSSATLGRKIVHTHNKKHSLVVACPFLRESQHAVFICNCSTVAHYTPPRSKLARPTVFGVATPYKSVVKNGCLQVLSRNVWLGKGTILARQAIQSTRRTAQHHAQLTVGTVGTKDEGIHKVSRVHVEFRTARDSSVQHLSTTSIVTRRQGNGFGTKAGQARGHDKGSADPKSRRRWRHRQW